jgi:Carboxypeptidase regulatory-like domain
MFILYPQPARRFNRHLASPCYRPNGLAPKTFHYVSRVRIPRRGKRCANLPRPGFANRTVQFRRLPVVVHLVDTFWNSPGPSGAVISHAIVLLRPPANRTPVRTETDSSGSFHFEKIPVGSYTLTIAAPAFKDATIPITFKGKRLPPLRVTLALASQSETVTVGEADSSPQVTTDTSQNQSADTFERAALDRVPVFDQDYITTLSRFLDDNSVSTNGVSLVVNGIEANGPGVTPSAVQEVRINQNPYAALFANPGRARLEITTKPRTPALHGSVNFLYRDAVFDASNAFALQKPPESRQYYYVTYIGVLGSPLFGRPIAANPPRRTQLNLELKF